MTALAVNAQQVQLTGVTSGVLFDPPTRSIRQVLGVPGGARFGTAIVTDLDDAWISPDGKSSVVLAAGQLSALRFQTAGSFSTIPWGSAPAKFKAVWSHDSKAAVGIFVQPDGSVAFQVWRTDRPAVDASVSTLFSSTVIRSLVVRARTAEILVAVQGPDQAGLHRVSFSGDVRQLIAMPGLEALALDTNDTIVYGFTSDGNLLQRFDTTADAQPVALPSQVSSDVTCPCWLAASPDSSHLALAWASPDKLFIYETATNSPPAEVLLEGPPEGLDAYGANGLFTLALRRQDAASALLLEVKSGSVYFVPPAPPIN